MEKTTVMVCAFSLAATCSAQGIPSFDMRPLSRPMRRLSPPHSMTPRRLSLSGAGVTLTRSYISGVKFIRMPQAFTRTDLITHELLQFFDLGKATFSFSVEQHFSIDGDNVSARLFCRLQAHRMQLFREGGQQLLGHIGSPEHPTAFWAIFD